MGQKPSHNLSLDSPRRIAGGAVIHERGELVHSHGGPAAAGITLDTKAVTMAGQSLNHGPHYANRGSLSPKLRDDVRHGGARGANTVRGTQPHIRKNRDLQGGSVHTD